MLAYPRLTASYAIPVRQYRSLPFGFLHCCCYQQPACHLLTVRSVTPARKGLPVRTDVHPGGTPSGIFSYFTYCLIPKICIFNIFSELSQKCAHAHAGHTHHLCIIAEIVVYLACVVRVFGLFRLTKRGTRNRQQYIAGKRCASL